MNSIFEIIDKSGREIRLTIRQWSHITTTHAKMAGYLEEIKEKIKSPLKIIH